MSGDATSFEMKNHGEFRDTEIGSHPRGANHNEDLGHQLKTFDGPHPHGFYGRMYIIPVQKPL